MRFGSVCSGIEAASVAWGSLGWKAAWLAEIEPFPCAVLAHHYPNTPNLGDMTKFNEWPTDDQHAIDLLCGGTPCQSFSVAGLRKGLDDPRGNLMLTFGAIAAKYRPQWLVWENVPGVLSSNGGRDFGAFLGMLGQLGYGFAYRVLDAQYFGVAQRRRRVFVVGCFGDWRSAAAVLFERHSLQGHPAPRRQAGKGATRGVEIGPGGGRFTDVNPTLDTRAKDGPIRNQLAGCVATLVSNGDAHSGFRNHNGLVPVPHAAISPALKARDHKGVSSDGDGDGDGAILVPMVAHSLRGEGFDASEDGTGRGTPWVPVVAGAFCKDTFSGGMGGKPEGAAAGHFLAVAIRTANTSANGHGIAIKVSHTLDQAQGQAIAFGGKMSAVQTDVELSQTLQAKNPAAVAYTTKLHNTTSNNAGKIFEERSTCLDANSPPPALLTAMQVRRLTPVECARLQGFPPIVTTARIEVCTDHQKSDAHAALPNLKSQLSASPAFVPLSPSHASPAEQVSATDRESSAKPAALHARIDYGRQQVQLLNAGRLIWSVSSADKANESPLRMPIGSFVQLAAHICSGRAKETEPLKPFSTTQPNGKTSARLSASEISTLASDALKLSALVAECLTFITSEAGQRTQVSGLSLQTLCSCAVAAIAGSIPEQMRNGFSLSLEVEREYLDITVRGKPAADGPKYKALGNSWAVPCVTWIGKRIDAVAGIQKDPT